MKLVILLLAFICVSPFSKAQTNTSADPVLTEDMISDPILTGEMVADFPLVNAAIPCKTKYPLYSDKDNMPIWFNSKQLKGRSIHCETPKAPLMSKINIEGTAKLSILVNPAGKVECITVVSGHALIIGSAVEAAKKWQFQPVRRDGKALAFYGLLEFHITTRESDHEPDPCLCGHWK